MTTTKRNPKSQPLSCLKVELDNLTKVIDAYLNDTEMSGCEDYDLDALVPIPSSKPKNVENDDSKMLAWKIKQSVVEVQRGYAEISREDSGSEGSPLPAEGLSLWKALLANSRVHNDAAAIYASADRFRAWAKSESQRCQPQPTVAPRWDAIRRTLYFGEKSIRQFRKNAKESMCILSAFEEEKWSSTIDSPVRGRLDRILDNMNKNLLEIEFHQVAGGDQIGWRQKPH